MARRKFQNYRVRQITSISLVKRSEVDLQVVETRKGSFEDPGPVHHVSGKPTEV